MSVANEVSPYGRYLEVTHEEHGLPEKDQYYSCKLNCNADEYDADFYLDTQGIIKQRTVKEFSKARLTEWAERVNEETKASALLMSE